MEELERKLEEVGGHAVTDKDKPKQLHNRGQKLHKLMDVASLNRKGNLPLRPWKNPSSTKLFLCRKQSSTCAKTRRIL